MTVRDVDAEYAFDDPDDGWFGAAEPAAAEPAALAQPLDELPARHTPPLEEPYEYVPAPAQAAVVDGDPTADTDRWFVHDMNLAELADTEGPPRAEVEHRPVVESVAATLTVVPTRRNGFVRTPAPASWESRLSNSGAWDIKSAYSRGPSRPKIALVITAVLAGLAAVVAVVLALRAPAEQSTPVVPPSQSSATPAPSTSTTAPSTSAPVLSSPAPPPPAPGPPPPPPPSAEQINPPVVTRQYTPRYDTPDEPKKPQTNVTRAPLSATPPAPPSPTNPGHATPGESAHHGYFG